MFTFCVVLIILACIVLAFVVLIQNSKGGGLASNFASSNQIMGVRKTTETIEKITWGLAIALAVLSLAATIAIPRHTASTEISTEVDVNAAKSVAPAPAAADVPVATDVAPAPEAE